jgi:hypothetical protein
MKTFIGRAMEGLLPHGVSLETNTADLKIMTAIAAVLASVTATLAAVANLVVVLYGGVGP